MYHDPACAALLTLSISKSRENAEKKMMMIKDEEIKTLTFSFFFVLYQTERARKRTLRLTRFPLSQFARFSFRCGLELLYQQSGDQILIITRAHLPRVKCVTHVRKSNRGTLIKIISTVEEECNMSSNFTFIGMFVSRVRVHRKR